MDLSSQGRARNEPRASGLAAHPESPGFIHGEVQKYTDVNATHGIAPESVLTGEHKEPQLREVLYIDRSTGRKEVEKVYGKWAVYLLYGDYVFSGLIGSFLRWFSKIPFFSSLYGRMQKRKSSTKKILPFVEAFEIDPSEFLKDIGAFESFNDFFIRKLKSDVRPIAEGREAILPADGRYMVYPDISLADGFFVKGRKFALNSFLQDRELAEKYQKGSMVLVRLCPADYHRFHFPVDCIPSKTRMINGYLYSVNPLALKRNIEIFCENKRVITHLESEEFGKVLFIEIGATNVGVIHQIFTPFKKVLKGDEKGYFSFGGSAIVLLFEPGKIQFDFDLVQTSRRKIETRSLFGQSLGTSILK